MKNFDYVDANTYASIAHYKLNPDYEGHSIKWNPDIIKQNSVVFVKKGLLPMFFENVKNWTRYMLLFENF